MDQALATVTTAGQVLAPRQARSPLGASQKADSKISVQSTASTASNKEYLDSLVPPSQQEFARITEVQEEREIENRRRSREAKRQSLDAQRRPKSPHDGGIDLRTRAARVIQRTYRGYRLRREMEGFGLNASTRWVTAIREAQYRELTKPKARAVTLESDGKTLSGGESSSSPRPSTAKENWRKAAIIARRANHDDFESDSESSSFLSSAATDSDPEKRAEARKRKHEANERRRKEARMMGLQYFLEMVDLKHRYGNNLRAYHAEWEKSDTHENFFYWLDYGEGKYIELAACPRDQLEQEQVRYLSREERQYYLVKVDEEGRLCWAKNGERIDTTTKYKDSIHGIVPMDDTTEAWVPLSPDGTSTAHSGSHDHDNHASTDSSAELERGEAAAIKYATPEFDKAKGMKKISHLSASTIFNKLLRKSVRKNTWIFVSDTNFRLYVGIKTSGAFQHSSFLQGGRISAAGLIKIKNGQLSSLSPLSGHYRPPAASFRAFVKSLKEEGVDMSHVSISKAYVVLVGLELYIKTRKKSKEVLHRMGRRKERLVHPEEARRHEEEEKDKSKSAGKERVIQQKKEEEQEEKKAEVKLLRKLNISPTEPTGQKVDNPEELEVEQEVANAVEAGP